MSIPFDQEFIDMMVPHHQAAVEMAKVAQEQAEHPELKKLADQTVDAQTSEIARMKQWRHAWFGEDSKPAKGSRLSKSDVPMDGSMDMKDSVARLRKADSFDKAFIEAMLPHHQSAVDMARKAQERAEHVEIKQLAAEMIAAQMRDMSRLRSWLDAWY